MIPFTRPRLVEFFVYYPRLCEREGDEHKKVLYHYPSNTPLNDQLNSIGLCEAVITFTNFFNSSSRSLHTSTTRRFFHRITEDVWVVMVVSLPANSRPPNEFAAYLEHDGYLNDQVMCAILSTACDTFELFNGKVGTLLHTEGVNVLKRRLDHFFCRYLRTMLFEHSDMLDCFNAIQFTAVEPTDFARVQGFLSRMRYAFRCIRHMTFFYDGRLVHSTLDLSYVRHLFHYLNSFLFSDPPDMNQMQSGTTKMKHLGRFLVGPKDLSDPTARVQCPVLCSPESDYPDCQLITYQALRVVLCVIVHGVDPIPMSFFVQFDTMIGPRLTLLAGRIAANQASNLIGGSVFHRQLMDECLSPNPVFLSAVSSPASADNGVRLAVEEFGTGDLLSMSNLGRARFIYWNPFTCAVMSTLHVFTGSGRRQVPGSKLILELMISLRFELHLRPSSWHEEVTVRLDPHVWLVARRSNGREVYMVFVRKKEDLSRLDSYIEELYNSNFRGLLLLN